MNRVLFTLAGVLTATAAWMILRGMQPEPVEVLAHKLEDAWADHHTRV